MRARHGHDGSRELLLSLSPVLLLTCWGRTLAGQDKVSKFGSGFFSSLAGGGAALPSADLSSDPDPTGVGSMSGAGPGAGLSGLRAWPRCLIPTNWRSTCHYVLEKHLSLCPQALTTSIGSDLAGELEGFLFSSPSPFFSSAPATDSSRFCLALAFLATESTAVATWDHVATRNTV